MAQLAFAAGGAIVGGRLFNRPDLGWLAGSLLYNFFGPKQTIEGPRIEDKKVLLTSYGVAIPRIYGTMRTSGIVHWSTDLIETKHKKSAKGQSTSTIEYTYSASFAVAIANRELSDIIKIYADGKVIYDVTGASESTTIANLNYRLYTGSETQERDPYMEATDGADDTPAYLGLAYVFFEDMQLQNYGNRIPNIEFLATAAGIDSYSKTQVTMSNEDRNPEYSSVAPPPENCWSLMDVERDVVYVGGQDTTGTPGDTAELTSIQASTNLQKKQLSSKEMGIIIDIGKTMPTGIGYDGSVFIDGGDKGTNNGKTYKLDPNSLGAVAKFGGGGEHPSPGRINRVDRLSLQVPYTIPNWGDSQHIVIIVGRKSALSGDWTRVQIISQNRLYFAEDTDPIGDVFPFLEYHGTFVLGEDSFGATDNLATGVCRSVIRDNAGFFWFLCGDRLLKYDLLLQSYGGTHPDIHQVVMPMLPFDVDLNASFGYGNNDSMLYNSEDNSLIITRSTSPRIIKYDLDSGTITQTNSDVTTMDTTSQVMRQGIFNGYFYTGSPDVHELLYKIDASTLNTLDTYDLTNWIAGSNNNWAAHYPTQSIFMSQYNAAADNAYWRLYLDRTVGGTEQLDVVIDDIGTQGRLESSDWDVTEASPHTVRGFSITKQMNSGAAITSLMPGYFFDCVVSDGVLKVVIRGNSPTFTIDSDDLGTDNRPRDIETSSNENRMPKEVEIRYIDNDLDHQVNMQFDRRSDDSIEGDQIAPYDLPIVFTADEAKQIAQKWLYSVWVEQVKHANLNSSVKHALLDPTDVGTLNVDGESFTIRLTDTGISNWITRMGSVEYDEDVYVSDVEADTGGVAPPTIAYTGASKLFVFDVPLLRDQDNVYNASAFPLYVVGAGYTPSWIGCVGEKSDTSSSDYAQITQHFATPTWGTVAEALPANPKGWQKWNNITLTVNLGQGELESKTRDQVLNGRNAALVGSDTNGWELIQFSTAINVSGTEWQISDIIRGLRGTDTAQIFNNHSIGDIFVLMESNIVQKYNAPISEYNANVYYRPVTIDSTLPPISFVVNHDANALKPWRPTYVQSTRDASQNITITWAHQEKVAGDKWLESTDTVPNSEAASSYDLDILDTSGGSVIATKNMTGSTLTYTYTAADQTTDGIVPINTSAATIAAVASTQRLTDSGNGFTAGNGYVVGVWIEIAGFTNPENNRLFEIIDVDGSGAWVELSNGYHDLVDETAGNTISIYSHVYIKIYQNGNNGRGFTQEEVV
ncbi:hypothetical protein DRH14_02015 [Candidatus Shapirobacteria bacterium]|nr:MAG: hypothetical protein DRH14_02015 [Candidatus Shapirobacteria bacterium]